MQHIIKKDEPKILFSVHIMDGYSFRNVINIIKSEKATATMVLTPRSIEISFINTNKCAIHNIYINTHELKMYKYDIRDEYGQLVPAYPIAFDSGQFLGTIRDIGRKDGLRFYYIEGDNKINIQPIKTTIKDPGQSGATFVNIRNDEYCRYELPRDEFYPADPNVRVIAKDFGSFCSKANSLKCTGINIIGNLNKVTLQAQLANDSVASVNTFVNPMNVDFSPASCSSTEEQLDMILSTIRSQEVMPQSVPGIRLNIVNTDEVSTVRLPIATAKALSKIQNISPPGSQLQFFFASGKPTKIKSPIGTYGTYTICIRAPRT